MLSNMEVNIFCESFAGDTKHLFLEIISLQNFLFRLNCLVILLFYHIIANFFLFWNLVAFICNKFYVLKLK